MKKITLALVHIFLFTFLLFSNEKESRYTTELIGKHIHYKKNGKKFMTCSTSKPDIYLQFFSEKGKSIYILTYQSGTYYGSSFGADYFIYFSNFYDPSNKPKIPFPTKFTIYNKKTKFFEMIEFKDGVFKPVSDRENEIGKKDMLSRELRRNQKK